MGKKKHEQAIQDARTQFERQHAQWRDFVASIPIRQHRAAQEYHAAEEYRLQQLRAHQAIHEEECRRIDNEVKEANIPLEKLIAAHHTGEAWAVDEYFRIVFSNSVYPDELPVHVEHSYSQEHRELHIDVELPNPDSMPTAKAYRYVKTSDTIAESIQSAKEQRERYTHVAHSIVLRTMHEVWEADRHEHIDTISLTASVTHLDPATGQPKLTPLVAVAADRRTFEGIDLAHVTPTETLHYLKAVVSKNAHALIPISQHEGVRRG
ncbi:hypothetical protein [Granulicoccus sp. GXG6511]|uniref:hypothetical protein n=1 Tax=Granulicoccus sp. GXG6511 TaxID=3381351 RepID=UPI003D7CD8D3